MATKFDTSAFEAEMATLTAGIIAVVIGFNTRYAEAVHEVLTSKLGKTVVHTQGQAKFLEASMRNGAGRGLVELAIGHELAKVTKVSQIRPAVELGVIKAAITILGDAQILCPIATGFLAASANWQEVEGERSGVNPANIDTLAIAAKRYRKKLSDLNKKQKAVEKARRQREKKSAKHPAKKAGKKGRKP